MCGRYAAFLPADALAAMFQIAGPIPDWVPTWNMAPTRSAPVVRIHPQSRDRQLDLLRWGLLPHWIKAPTARRQPINARSEGLVTSAMFHEAFAQRRCLVPADVYYEWQTTDSGSHPWAIARADGLPLVFAGLWEGWRSPNGAVVRSFAIATTSACPTLRPLHERMPVVLEAADFSAWLGETEADPTLLLKPSTAAFRTWRIGPAVNKVRNDSAALLEPV